MGVVNVTPDSFSDGGKWLDPASAIRHGIELAEHGADLVDVGGESTRPGAIRIDGDEELRRVVPVIEGLVADGITVSVDTMRSRRSPSRLWMPVRRSSTTSRAAALIRPWSASPPRQPARWC